MELNIILASFVLSYVLVKKDGVFDILKNMRYYLGVNQPVASLDDPSQVNYISNGSVIGDLFSCPICLSFYITPLVIMAEYVSSGFVEIVAIVGAVVALLLFLSD